MDIIKDLNSVGTMLENPSGVEAEFSVTLDKVKEFTKILKKNEFLILFTSAVHSEMGFVLIYQFVNPDTSLRVRFRVLVSPGQAVETISDIYEAASWYEREIMEFFGIDFEGLGDKRTLILPEEDKDLKPLLKKEKSLKGLADIGME